MSAPVPKNEEPEIVAVRCDGMDLVLTVEFFPSNERWNVRFDHALGFRALQESDLSYYWDVVNTSKGWLFRVDAGGWKEQETLRNGFLSAENFAREYFIIGCDYSMNVFSSTDPEVSRDVAV